MAMNVQDSGRDFWRSSPSTDMASPESFNCQSPKSIGLEAECSSSSSNSRSQNMHASKLPRGWPITPNPEEMPSSQVQSGPPVSADLPHVDLHEWYPKHMACMQHFLDQGQHSLPVQSLAAFINIRLPCQRLSDPIMRSSSPQQSMDMDGCGSAGVSTTAVSHVSLRPYIQRLIVTGNDTPAVLEAFFGADWHAGVSCVRSQERINYLFTAKSSGWASTKAAYDILPDEQAPFLRPLGGATEEELRIAESRWSEWLAMEDWMVGPRSPW